MNIWDDLRTNLQGMVHLTIIGYSLPAEDKELRYYLRDEVLNSKDFKGVTIVTGTPKISPSNQEIIQRSHLPEIQKHDAWDQYLSFFGTELLESVEHNILNFWTYGFFDYFRRFVNPASLSHAEEGISEIIKNLYF